MAQDISGIGFSPVDATGADALAKLMRERLRAQTPKAMPAAPAASNPDGSSVNPMDDRVRLITGELNAAKARMAANDPRAANDVAALTRELASLGGSAAPRASVMQSSLRGNAVGGPAADTLGAQPPAAPPVSGIDWRARSEALAKQYEAANAPPDMSALISEGQRRGGEGMNNLMLALAAQQAGKEHEPMAGTFLKRAMALQDPMKFSGGQVDENGNVVMDPGYKREQQLAHLDRMGRQNDTGQLAEQNQANQRYLTEQRIGSAERIAGAGNASREGIAAAGNTSREGIAADRQAGGHQISDAGVKHLAGLETSKSQLDALHATFRPEYARKVPLPGSGQVENWLGDVAGTPASQWWKQVMANQNAVLKELSGSAVTASEAARFQAAFLNPNMPAETIPGQIRKQAEAAQAARDKLIQVYGQAGRNVSGFSGAPAPAGPAPAAPMPAPAPAPSGGGTVKWGNLK